MTDLRVHVGCGAKPLPGWLNVDIAQYPGVDLVLDVREGLHLDSARYIFAEHFLEHLTLEEGLSFLRDCRRILSDEGVLRLSTPNLDWVWLTHYKKPDQMDDRERLLGCLEMNRAFHGWGHQFLYNLHTLTLVLRAAGFAQIHARSYGESPLPALRELEQHERHEDVPGSPSVIVVEAGGRGEGVPDFANMIDQYVRDAEAK